MVEFMCRRRGAISIFLVIVLVPMLMVSSVMVDMSRIRLAKAVASSAGDLTLNTALTNYDSVLKNMYGLFATSQDMDELFENLEDYYKKSIEAAGVAPAEADDYVGQIMSLLKSSTGTDDLLKLDLTEFTASKPTGANLANPAILKSQVVEFMKYRAPINLGTSFIEAIRGMKDFKTQTELIEQKTAFYEQQQGLLEDLESVWKDIQTYQYADADTSKGKVGFPTGNYLRDQKTKLDNYAGSLRNTWIPETIKYWYKWESFEAPELQVDYADNSFEIYGDEIGPWPVYDEDNLASAVDLHNLYNTLLSMDYVAEEVLEEDSLYAMVSGTTDILKIKKIYLVTEMAENYYYGYVWAVKDVFNALANLENAWNYCDMEGIEEYTVKYISEDNAANWVSVDEYSNVNIYDMVGNALGDSKYKNTVSYLRGYINRLDTYHGLYIGAGTDITESIGTNYNAMCDTASDFYWFIDGKIKTLSSAISKLETIETTLSSPDSEYNKMLSAWETKAGELADDSMGKADKAEIDKLKEVLTVKKVQDFITRLNGAKTSLESVKTQIQAYKFEGTSWMSIPGANDFESFRDVLLSRHDSERSSIVPTTENAYDSIIQSSQSTVLTGNIATDWSNQAVHVDLTKNQHALYTWLYNNFYNPNMTYSTSGGGSSDSSSSSVDDGDDEVDKIKENLKNDADEYKEKEGNKSTEVSTNINDYINFLPTKEWSELKKAIEGAEATVSDAKMPGSETIETDQDKLASSGENSGSDAISELLGGLMEAVNDMATGLRDKMYIANYIMTMFSYDTIEAETMRENGGDLSQFESWYEKKEDTGKYEVKEKFAKYASEAKTLTNVSINPNMNYLYGSEIEYMIYGNASTNTNKGIAYGSIFAIRFAFNTVYAFTDAEITSMALAAATAVFGVPPLTPLVPIAKIAIIIGLSIAESAYDLYLIKTGAAVPLMKNSKTWTMKPSSAAKAVVGEVATVVANKALDKGYELLNKAIDMTDEELQKLIDESVKDFKDGTDQLSQLAEETAQSVIDQYQSYANEVLQEVVSLCNQANSNEMMNKSVYDEAGKYLGMPSTPEKVAYVLNELENNWLVNQVSTDPVIYEIKKMAVECFKSKSSLVESIFTAIDNTAKLKSTAEETIDNVADEFESTLKLIRDELKLKLNEFADTAGTKLKDLKDTAKTKIQEAAKNGVESLRTELNKQIGNVFGTSDGKLTKTNQKIVSSLLSWSYSDYLMLFLVVSLLVNEEAVILRMADVIELNMQHKDATYASITTTETKTVTESRFFGLIKKQKEVTETKVEANDAAFKLSKAYTYISIEATVQVKPLLMTLPFMADTAESQLPGEKWYEIKYQGTLGY